MSSEQKPSLALVPGKKLTAEALEALYEKLTGKKFTPQEMAQARERLAKKDQEKA